MSTPAAKRRRMDAASSALSKPFRSPFRRPVTTTLSDDRPGQKYNKFPNDTPPTENEATQLSEPAKLLSQLACTPLLARAGKKPFWSPISTAAANTDPDIAPLVKQQRQLEKKLRELREELDVAEQATKIEADSERKNPGGEIDGELLELIQKWRRASRQAAEELFAGVRDRVNRMGGPKAWKEMQNKQKEFRSGWDAESQPPDSDGEGGQDVERRDLYAEYDIDPETANEKEARRGNEIHEDGEAEDEFTMSMMLRSLNVPLSTIGYDKEQQRWAD